MLTLFPVQQATVMTGAGGTHPALSAIHPHPIEAETARRLGQTFGTLAGGRPPQDESPRSSRLRPDE